MITERQQVNKKYWDMDDYSYLYRIDAETRRRIFWCTAQGKGRLGNWVIQIIDNEGNQIGDADYAANKRCLRTI